jgi:hypothetical protein
MSKVEERVAKYFGGALHGTVMRTISDETPCVQEREGHFWIATYRHDGTFTDEGWYVYRLGDDEGPGERQVSGDGTLGRMLKGDRV